MAINNKSNFYVTDDKNQVQIFDQKGIFQFKFKFKSTENTDRRFIRQSGIMIDSDRGHIIITDKGDQQVQIYNLQGEFLHQFGFQESVDNQLTNPIVVGISERGLIVVIDDNLTNQKLINTQLF